MKLSARNLLKGKIVEVKKGQTTAHVRIDVGGSIVTSSITNEAVDELKLAAGQSGLCGHQGVGRDDRDRLILTSLRWASGAPAGVLREPPGTPFSSTAFLAILAISV
jgi:molybdopterin-binding protein